MIKVSPSQIDTFDGCPRKWGLPILDGHPRPPQHPSAALGERVHKVVEDWMKDGKPFPKTEEGEIAMPVLQYLPPPKVADVEKEWSFHEPDGNLLYNGRKDGRWYDNDGLVLFDLKTTSNLQWALTEESLASDIQGMLYAEAEFRADPKLKKLELFWLYATTKGKRRARPVRITITREHAAAAFTRIHAVAKEMAEIRRAGGSALDLPPNVEHCSAYGGCPFRGGACNLTNEERLRSAMSKKKTLKEQMMARLKEQRAKKEEVEVEVEVELGVCSCGTEAEVKGGKMVPHEKPDGKKCPGGKAPLPEEAAKETKAAINPPEAPKVQKTAPAKSNGTMDWLVLEILTAMDPAAVQRARKAAEAIESRT